MRIHFGVALLVLIASLFVNLTRVELVVVIATICLVLMAEMINSAIEAVVDIITDEFDPRAKIAKDVSAGAVLVAAINALVVAYLVFADKLSGLSLELVTAVRRSPTHLTFVALAVLVIVVISIKAARGRTFLLSGGLPSGHSALAFAGWTAVTFVTASVRAGLLVSAVSFITAALVAQSRVETGIHSVLEVVLGAILGIVVTMLIFQLWF
jgi:diacylglycerol kinase (ATP)